MANPKDDPEYDEWCDPDNPRTVNFDGIVAASRRIVGKVVKTPCMRAHMSKRLGLELYMKAEFLQATGCFKERGVINTLLMLSEEQKKNGVAAASTGNHAGALAYHSTQLGIPSIVVMPTHAPITKVNKAERLGAKLILHGASLSEAKHYAMTMAKEKKMMYINGSDHPNVIEGQGTIGIEVIEQVPNVDAILIPCGGGSLLVGTAIAIKHLKPDVEVYGVVTDKTFSMIEALKRNEPIFIPLEPTIADGLAVNKAGVNTFHNIRGVVDKMVVVREDWVARAIMRVIEEEKVVIEGAAAVGIASIMAGLFPHLKGKTVVAVCSGGNIDATTLSRALERGMAAEGRLMKFKVTVSDRPGGLAELASMLASMGVTMRDCVPERAWVKGDVFSVQRAHMSKRLGLELYMKAEFLQATGCFKERGVINTLLMLSEEQKKNGVAAASTGNHAGALAYHSTQLGIPSIVVMPTHAPITKVNKAERLGAKLILHGASLSEAKHYAMTMAKEKKMMYINGSDHPNVIEGQGTIGIEVIEQVPNVDAILIPCGGGSLLVGTAIAIKHLKPDVEVYGVVTDKTFSMIEALKRNEPIFIPLEPTIADGLAVNKAGVNTFHNIRGVVDKMVVVREDWVARAIMRVIEEEKVVIEGAAAVGIASIMAGLFPHLKGKTVVAVCSGGNIDATTLSRALERGMAAEGRLMKFKVTVSDRPGGLAELASMLASMGVTMRDCVPERAWVKGDVFSVQLKVIVETRGWDHTKQLVEIIKKHYKEYFFQDMEKIEGPGSASRGPCTGCKQ
uniref:L-serine deaminase n=1 Tax=Heliothis virescens TaxID=7102 RepID=A0A2A4J248_HELVI